MAAAEGDDFDVETTPGYKAPAKVDLETLQNLDADDEALNRWKAKLLEGASAGKPIQSKRRRKRCKELVSLMPAIAPASRVNT